MPSLRRHTRINITPSAPNPERPCTVGNAYCAYVNMMLARNSGGTFIIQFEDEFAYNSGKTYRDRDLAAVCQRIVEQFAHFGIKPSEPSLFKALDINAPPVMVESDYSRIIDAIWKYILPLRKLLPPNPEEWPIAWSEHCRGPNAVVIRPLLPPCEGEAMMLPHSVASCFIMDLISGRNCIAPGADCGSKHAMYRVMADLLRVEQVTLLSLPMLGCAMEGETVEGIIHTSGVGSTPPYNIFSLGYLMQANVPAKALWQYLEEIICYPGCKFADLYYPADVHTILRRSPVLKEAEWREFTSSFHN